MTTNDPIALDRAIRSLRCLPLRRSFFEAIASRPMSSTDLCERDDANRLLFAPCGPGRVEAHFNWLIRLGVLRREVDGQGLTDRVRLTPLGRELLDRWPGEIPRARLRRGSAKASGGTDRVSEPPLTRPDPLHPCPLMVLGTSSGAGKSLMTAALCRVLRRRGETPVPFKGQNMSLNAWVDKAGGEMAYSQALQAWSAGLEPEVAMNPVLLKPRGDSTSEVIHLGRSVGTARAEHYYQDWFRPGWSAIRSGLEALQITHPGGRLVLEGAGSPVEVNLQSRDLTNLRLAQYLRARCLLVADIERGGVFAQIVGTLTLLRPVERRLIRGLLINRFRGRRELFREGRRWLEEATGLPVLGVMPWLQELFPPEDSLDLLERRGQHRDSELTIVALRLPSLSNFSDLDPLEAEPSVRILWRRPGETLGNPDAIILPGSKQTLRDLAELKARGTAEALRSYAMAGGQVFGICGGLQMLGQELSDPEGLEGCGGQPRMIGLGLLPLRTEFVVGKALRQRHSRAVWPEGVGAPLTLEGFELHHGRSQRLSSTGHCAPLAEDPGLGWWRECHPQGGHVAGTYLHGIFESGPWRRRWLNQLRLRRDLPPLSEDMPHHLRQREALLDRLADAFEAHVNLAPLLQDTP